MSLKFILSGEKLHLICRTFFASYPIGVSFNLFAFLRRSFNASRASILFSLMSSAPVTIETVEDEDAIEVVRENKGPERLSEVIFRLIEQPGDCR